MAATVDSPKAFRLKADEEVDVRGRVRGRLERLDELVDTAVKAGAPHNDVPVPELTWRLLSCLSLIELRLEEADFSDRTHAVERLQRVTPTGDPSDASALFGRLAELVGTYAPSGAIVTPEILRKDLSGLPFLHFPDLSAETLEVRSTPATKKRTAAPARQSARGRSVPGQPTEKWNARTISTAARQPLLCDGTVVVRDGLWLLAFDAGTGDRLWSRKTLYDDMPVLGAGAVYFAGPLNCALSVDLRSGKKRLPLPVPLHNGFAAFDKGTLYTSGPEGALRAIDPVSRKLLWPKPTSGPMVAAPKVREGVVFALVNESSHHHSPTPIANNVLAVDAETGELQWRLPTALPESRQWQVGRHATYVVQDLEPSRSRVTALDLDNGETVWEHELEDRVASPPVESDGAIYLVGNAGSVCALDAKTGGLMWQERAGRRISAAPLVTGDLVIVGGENPNRITAFDAATGTTRWSKPGQGAFTSSPFAVGSAICAAHRAGDLLAWHAETGKQLWKLNLRWDPRSQGEPLVENGVLYAATARGTVHAVTLH
ncbi:PQQ-binding-like beta-propeller repeat protein [Streptomyces celluloflavus]|uniref:PQQ-binding-like beta-propeller repeat protein n=1 Tax=Streptomyces celluloflavus TaxID=58344 RepID=UPI00345F8EB9|nr:PQQ-binding-like beta-propeller repeat protein [Streptomyces celluloflavus]